MRAKWADSHSISGQGASLVGGLLAGVEWLGSASVVGKCGGESMLSTLPAKTYEKLSKSKVKREGSMFRCKVAV